jgi:hypothetical protein
LMRLILIISATLVALFIIDVTGFRGKLRDTGKIDLWFKAYLLSDEWKRSMIRPPQNSGAHPVRRMLFRPVRLHALTAVD